jgi:hypothetical protein
MPAYTSSALVAAALGASAGPAFEADPYSGQCVAASNAWVGRKRTAAGYVDVDGDLSAEVVEGATLYAVGLYRERASTDGFAGYEDLSGFAQIGSNGRVRQLLGLGVGLVDGVEEAELAAWRARRRRRLMRRVRP